MNRNEPHEWDARVKQSLLRGTDSAANRAGGLWARLQAAQPTKKQPKRSLALGMGALAVAAVAGVFLLVQYRPAPDDLVTTPAAAAASQSGAAQTLAATASQGSVVDQFDRLQKGGATTGQLLSFLEAHLGEADATQASTLAERYVDLIESKITIHMNYEDNYSTRLATIALSSDEAMQALIALRGKTELGDQADKFSADDRAFLENLFASDCTVDFADGMPHCEVRYRELATLFGDAVTKELAAYLDFSALEAEKPYALEGMFEVEPVEVARRWQKAVDYLATYKDASPVRREKLDTYRELYLAAYFTNFGQLFRVEDRTVPQDQRTWLDKQINEADGEAPKAAALLREYKALLAEEGWMLTDAVRAFLHEQDITGYEPASKLTWDNLKIWGVKLDTDGDEAIAALSAAIQTAGFDGKPTEDRTAQDNGGRTRTVRWKEGTVAVVRNDVLYSISTTNALAPLPLGLQLGASRMSYENTLGQGHERVEGADYAAWGIGSNDNLVAAFPSDQASVVTISLSE